MTVKQYPRIIIIPTIPGETPKVNGIYQPAAPGTPIRQKCRYEPATRTTEIQLDDGLRVKYIGIVYMPLNAPDIAQGVIIEVENVVKAKSLYFSRDQMNCRLYI